MVKIKMRASHNDDKSQEHRTRVSQRNGIHLLKHMYMANQNDEWNHENIHSPTPQD
jgi:hypothetical protein